MLKPVKSVALFFIAYFINTVITDFTIFIGPGHRECFYKDFQKGVTLDSSVAVVKGGDLDIRIELKDPYGNIIKSGIASPTNKIIDHSEKRYLRDSTHFSYYSKVEQDGRYSLCLDNSYSIMTEKLVTFELDADGDESLPYISNSIEALEKKYEDNSTLNPLHTRQIQVVGNRIYRAIMKIREYQKSHRLKERRHRYLAEANLSRVTWFSFLSCLIMIGVTVMQVFIVKNLFEENTKKKFMFW